MIIQESAENYLESIYMIHKKKGNVRSIDIVNELELSKPSVSVAMKNLRENGYILMDAVTGFISLTDKGTEIAEKMYERHTLLSGLLVPRRGQRDRASGCLPHGTRHQHANL